MKFHLPKKLLVAVLAAMAVSTIQPASAEAYLVGIGALTNDAQTLFETVSKYPGYDVSEYVRPAVVETTADAPVQLDSTLATESADAYMPIYVREGQLVMTDGLHLNYREPDNGCMLQVAGNNASMIISDDALFEEDHQYYAGYVSVGGSDGSGELILKSGGSIHLDKSLTSGYYSEASWYGAQTVFATYDGTDAASGRYADGQYETVTYIDSDGKEQTRKYGKGTIVVDGSSDNTDAKNRTTLKMGTSMFLAHADMSITNGGLLSLGTSLTEAQNTPELTYNGWEGCNILGRQHGCTTNLEITEGGEMNVTGSLVVGTVGIYDAEVNIKVDGKAGQDYGCGVAEGTASKLIISHVLGLGVGSTGGDIDSSSVNMSVTNGGVVEAADVRLGLDAECEGLCTTSLHIDEASSLKTDSIRLGKGATVVNKGTVARLTPAVATYSMRAGMPPMTITGGASWTNAGTLDMDVVVEGGTFIAEDGSVCGGLTTSSGAAVSISGKTTFNGDVSINDSILTFGAGAKVTANGNFDIDSDTAVSVLVDGASAANGTLFTITSWNESSDAEVAITLVNANGEECGWGYAQVNGSGDVTLGQGAGTVLSLNRNQQSFYTALQNMSMAGAASPEILELVMSHDTDAVKSALDAMSGHEYATAMSSQIEGNLGHLRRLRGAMGKGTALGSYVAAPGSAATLDEKGNEVQAATPAVTDIRNWRVGVSAFHEETEIDSDARGDGYDRSETGAMLTAEYYVNKDVTLGGAISYGRTKLSTDGAKSRHEDNTRFDVYALYGQKRWSFATSLGLGMHEHELLGGDVDGYSINFLQDAAYTVLSREKDNVQVFGTFESSWNEIDSCSDGVVSADSQDAWATDVTVGLRYNRALPALGNAPAGVFTAQAGVSASIGDIKSGVDMDINGYGYRQESATRNRWGWTLGAGVDVPVRTNVSVYGAAEAVLRGDSNSVDGQIGVKVSF